MPGISAVIIARDEVQKIGDCIGSLEGVAEEVIVYDSGSTDGTQQLAKTLGARVIEGEWLGYAQTKNAANTHARHPYILSMDADEVLSSELIASLIQIKPHLSGAYKFNRLTSFGDHYVRYGGWYPDAKLRLFPREVARWEGEFVHEQLTLEEGTPVALLKGDLLHHSFDSIADYWERVNGYTTLGAKELYERGKKATWLKLWLGPTWVFYRMFWLRGGFRDGGTGWMLAKLSATYHRLKYLKLRELYQKGNINRGS